MTNILTCGIGFNFLPTTSASIAANIASPTTVPAYDSTAVPWDMSKLFEPVSFECGGYSKTYAEAKNYAAFRLDLMNDAHLTPYKEGLWIPQDK